MYNAHKHLKCDTNAFNATVEDLVNTFVRCGVDQQTI